MHPVARLLLCLPLCLVLVPDYPAEPPDDSGEDIRVAAQDNISNKSLPDPAAEPIAFLEACLKHYDAKVTGYKLTFVKQELVQGKRHKPEEVLVRYRDHPYSVFFLWKLPKDNLVKRALYVEGEDLDPVTKKSRVKIITSLPFPLDKDPEGSEARQQSRFPINTFGLRQAMEQVVKTWKAARAENALHVRYLGQYKVRKAGDRQCFKFERTSYAHPEGDDNIGGLIIYIDCQTLLQVGSKVYDTQGKELGQYYFRDIELNPQFPDWQFAPEALKKPEIP